MADLIDVYGWKHVETYELWNEPGDMKSKLWRRFGELPEVVLFWEGYDLLGKHEAELKSLDCRKCVFTADLHLWDEGEREWQLKQRGLALCEIILANYAYVFHEFYPDLAGEKKVVWIPHSASPDFLMDYNDHPANVIFLGGNMDPVYPLRRQMKSLYDRRIFPIVCHPHPGYGWQFEYGMDDRVGRGYATKINKLRAAFTDCSKYRYIVAKYFEIPATGSLLIAEGTVSEWLAQLGFVPGTHYLAVSAENLEQIIQYVLNEENHGRIDAIRRRGQELVRKAHKTSDRARMIHEACAVN
jgi:hypothetical protein